LNLKKKLDYSTLILIFFLFLGYLEASFPGIIAGFLLWGIGSLFLPFTTIPYFGYLIFHFTSSPILDNLSKFLTITTLREKYWLFFQGVGLGLNICVSVLVTILIILAIYYFKKRKNLRELELYSEWERLKEFIKTLNWKEIKKVMKNLLEKLKELKGVNSKLVGSSIFFLGLGIASHDFWWECEEWKVDTERPTHGVYIGLGLTTTGIQIIESSLKKNWLHYLGLASCYLGFNLLVFLPRGPSRWISHVFWWLGTCLMGYNWFKLVGKELLESNKSKEIEEIKGVIESVWARNS